MCFLNLNLENMKTEKILKTTTSRSDYNRAYKARLESTREIYCSRCRYHKGENETRGFYRKDEVEELFGDKYPSWKLASKNPKQWMRKNRIIVIHVNYSNSKLDYKRILVRNDY